MGLHWGPFTSAWHRACFYTTLLYYEKIPSRSSLPYSFLHVKKRLSPTLIHIAMWIRVRARACVCVEGGGACGVFQLHTGFPLPMSHSLSLCHPVSLSLSLALSLFYKVPIGSGKGFASWMGNLQFSSMKTSDQSSTSQSPAKTLRRPARTQRHGMNGNCCLRRVVKKKNRLESLIQIKSGLWRSQWSRFHLNSLKNFVKYFNF